MSWNDVPAEKRANLLTLYNARSLTAKHAQSVGMNLQTLKRRLRELRETQAAEGKWVADRMGLDMPPQRVYTNYFVLETDNVIVCSDWEWPDTDPEMIRALVYMGIRHNIRTLVIAGDLISGDHEKLNTWAEVIAESGGMNLPDEYNLLHEALERLANWFTDIRIITGNHDERLSKATGGHVTLGMLLRYSNPNVQFSVYRKMYLRTSRGTYKISHPRNYSQISLGLGQKLSNTDPGPDRNGERVGVIVAHTHHGSFGFTQDGSREVVGLGCMRDPAKTKYKSTGDATNPEWNQGFLMVMRGFFYPAWKYHTDWEFWLGEYADRLSFVNREVKRL